MPAVNLISAYGGSAAYEEQNGRAKGIPKPYPLKNNETVTLSKLCKKIRACCADFSLFDGYFIGYIIKQIGKEFDLLRFSDDAVVNIEMKSPLDLTRAEKIEKILSQQIKNYHYINALNRKIYICTYVENDGLYEYQPDTKTTKRVSFDKLIRVLKAQRVNEDIEPDKLFQPINFLISPFVKTDNFISGEYFLTEHQETIKKNILSAVKSGYSLHCINADAGTGKTLLLYDLAKTVDNSLVIHCGKLNSGHERLINTYGWKIVTVKTFIKDSENELIKNSACVFADEAQRMSGKQLRLLAERSKQAGVPVIFSYDARQFLSKNESKDVYQYICERFSGIQIQKYELTRKIRTNHNMASFINNLLDIGSDRSLRDYSSITVEYFETPHDVISCITYLEKERMWKYIAYSDELIKLPGITALNAHDVIGQEFDKVVFIMDGNFHYDPDGRLNYNPDFSYELSGMLYQIVTRAVSRLKIIVFQNKPLYLKLLKIKGMGGGE